MKYLKTFKLFILKESKNDIVDNMYVYKLINGIMTPYLRYDPYDGSYKSH